MDWEDTNLENVLLQHHVGRLLVVGAQTDARIRSTLHGAFVRGYDTTLISDAHTTDVGLMLSVLIVLSLAGVLF